VRKRSSRAVHAKCQSRRIYNRSVAPTIHVKLAAAPQHPTALVASRTIIASPIGVRTVRTLLHTALGLLNAEGDASANGRSMHALLRQFMRVMCCVRVRT
jgi:hypothetical protein